MFVFIQTKHLWSQRTIFFSQFHKSVENFPNEKLFFTKIYPNETLLYKECIVYVLKMLQLQTKFEFGRKWQKRLAGTVRGEILGFENKIKSYPKFYWFNYVHCSNYYLFYDEEKNERENVGLYFLRNAEISNAIALHFVKQYRTEEKYRNLARRVRSQRGGNSIFEKEISKPNFWQSLDVHPVV